MMSSDSDNLTRESFNDKTIGEIIQLVSDGGGDWGSCQYSGVVDMFYTLKNLKTLFGREEALKILNISVKYTKINDNPDFSEIIKQKLEYLEEGQKHYEACKEWLKSKKYPWEDPVSWFDNKTPSQQYEYMTKYEVKEYEKELKKYTQYTRITPYGYIEYKSLTPYIALELCKESSWDLWSTAPYIAKKLFTGLEINYGGLNVLRKYGNYETGLYCWLIWDSGLIYDKTSDATFGGFDT
jgi:hypothetical protein